MEITINIPKIKRLKKVNKILIDINNNKKDVSLKWPLNKSNWSL